MIEKVKAYVAGAVRNPRAAARSALTTALSVAAGLALLIQLGAPIPAEWVAWSAAAIGVLRTLVAALDPGQPLYGRTRE